MVAGLERVQDTGDLHFVTFSCFGRSRYLGAPAARDLFEDALQNVHLRYRFAVLGYVVMPEHVHLLVSEPRVGTLAVGLQALKLSVVRRSMQRPFWLPRYYDFNVYTEVKRIEKLQYMHWNPIRRGLVERPEDWRWSSCNFDQRGESGRVTIDSTWKDH